MSALIGAFGLLLFGNLFFQHRNYGKAIEAALKTEGTLDHAALISYTRALDFSVVKTSSVFMGFTLVLLGALYLLRVAETSYSLGLETGETKVSLQTASPGLVLTTLGVISVLFAVYARSSVTYEPPPLAQSALSPAVAPARLRELADSLAFAPGKTALADGELGKVDELCRYVSVEGASYAIEVFGDPGADSATNQVLADRRTEYLRDLLTTRCKQGPNVRAISVGKERPTDGADRGQVRVRSSNQ